MSLLWLKCLMRYLYIFLEDKYIKHFTYIDFISLRKKEDCNKFCAKTYLEY